MVGGYQIIDVNNCVLDDGAYIWIPKIKPNFAKPIRLQGLKGKSTNNEDLDYINVWNSCTQDSSGIIYHYEDTDNGVTVEIELSYAGYGGGAYGSVIITDDNT